MRGTPSRSLSFRLVLFLLATLAVSSLFIPIYEVVAKHGAFGIFAVITGNLVLAAVMISIGLNLTGGWRYGNAAGTGSTDDVAALREGLRISELARDEAERTSRLRSEFFANMSHEIRTPLNGILGLAEALAADEKDPDRISSLKMIRQSGRNLLHLINEILDLSKLEEGRMNLHPSIVSLSDLIRESASTIEVGCQNRGINLSVEVAPNVPATINADSHKLVRVLINLLGNALKFTERGSIGVKVAPYSGEKKGDLIFEVADTGRGIPIGLKEHIFESFIQVSIDDERREDGTGLGLAITRKLVELMGGEIWLESELGKGSRFYFTISAA